MSTTLAVPDPSAAEPDEAARAAARLDAALDRIAARQPAAGAGHPPAIDPRITGKLDNLIRALRTALDT